MDQEIVNIAPVYVDNIINDAYNLKYEKLHKDIDTAVNKLFENISDLSNDIKKVLQERCTHFKCQCKSVFIYFKYFSSSDNFFRVEFINRQLQVTVYSEAIDAINSHRDYLEIWSYECKRLCYTIVERVFNSLFGNYTTAKFVKSGTSSNNYFYIEIVLEKPDYDT